MTILAIIVISLVALYILGGLIFKHKLIINKFIIILLIVAVATLVISSRFGNSDSDNPNVKIPYYQEIAPPFAQAPKVLQTNSRVYYVATCFDDGKVITLYDYYVFNKDNWQYCDKPLPIDRSVYGEVKLYNR
jgi:hypothetical protein